MPEPPIPEAAASPSFPPLQLTLEVLKVAETAFGSVMVTSSVSVHAFASVVVTVYVPAVNPVAVATVAPELQAYVFVPVPPVPAAVAAPSFPPLQVTFVDEDIDTETAEDG